MDTLRMTGVQRNRWLHLMTDVRGATGARFPGARRARSASGDVVTIHGLSALLKRSDGPIYTVVRLGRIFRGALQVDANGAGKDITAAIRLIERAEEGGRITALQRAELFEIMGVPS